MSRPSSLPAWLAYLETLHPKAIAMGLARVRRVYAQMNATIACPIITVGGTNGKGSTCAMLESIYRRAGFSVGLYTSPHLLDYNERVRLRGRLATDDELVEAFNVVEDARLASRDADGAPTLLTYFEFGTLAALWLFARAQLDVLILEVGLGGRLDAVNLMDANVAILTCVDLDHMEYLGSTRAAIGFEKAGIFRAGKPAICVDADPPSTVRDAATKLGTRFLCTGRDFGFTNEGTQWRYWGPAGERFGLPFPALRGAYQIGNAAGVLTAVFELRTSLPVSTGALRDGLLTVDLPGRFQVLPGRPTIVLDVAHNPHAARALADSLGVQGFFPITFAVFAMYADKDIDGVIGAMTARIDQWWIAPLPQPRGANADMLRQKLLAAGIAPTAIRVFATVDVAYEAAREAAVEADRIVVFGSFLTVAAVLRVEAAVRAG